MDLSADGGDPYGRQGVVESGGLPEVLRGLRGPGRPPPGRTPEGVGQLRHGLSSEGSQPGGA